MAFTHFFSNSRYRMLAWYPFLALFSLLFLSQCYDADAYDTTLHFPKKFSFDTLWDKYTEVVYYENSAYTNLKREQAGSFAAFIDTVSTFTENENMKLPFTTLEFLDSNNVRLISDGSPGIPVIDTIVGYSKEDQRNISIITIDWGTTPIQCALTDWDGQSIDFTAAVYTYTYHPHSPPFTQYHTNDLSVAYFSYIGLGYLIDYMGSGGQGHDSDFSNRDTLGAHWVEITFK